MNPTLNRRSFVQAAGLAALPLHAHAALPLDANGLDAQGQMQSLLPPGEGFAWQRLAAGLQWRVAGVVKSLLFYGPGLVRVCAHAGLNHANQPSPVVVATPQRQPFTLQETAAALELSSGLLRIRIDKRSGALAFARADGQALLREAETAPASFEPARFEGSDSLTVRQRFSLRDDEALYGLGQYNEAHWNLRGRDIRMVQTNIGAVVPFLVSTRRWGLLWDICSRSDFHDGADGLSLTAANAPAGVDYYLVAGDDMDGVIQGYRQLTGAAPLPPRWAFGLFMSKERYRTQQQLLDVARRFREDRFPLDVIVQDWQYWGGDKDGTWSGMIWNAERFPTPAAMVNTLHAQQTRLMVSIWPSVGNDTALAHELDTHKLRFPSLHWISGKARIYDAFSPTGRAIYNKHVKQGLLDIGVDALWMDGTEVEVGGACHDPAQVEADILGLGRNALGDFARYLNVYGLMTVRGAYEAQRQARPQRVFTLTRSAWAGQQRYAAVPWSGDTTASWATLRAQVAGGLSIAMAGLPYWTQDTGGFFVPIAGGERNPVWRELYARWNQFGIFNPIYRIHGTDVEREPWLFKTLDPEVYRSLRRAAELRYRLLPYLYGLAWRTTAEGYTMMRGLPMDFPDQPALRDVDDSFMFGPALLVQPITRPMSHPEAEPAPTIVAAQLRQAAGQPGLAVTYFEGKAFEREASRAVDAQVQHRWPGPPLAAPPPGLNSLDHFSARWQGELVAPEGGEYEIGLEGDDGFRLWLDGELVVEDWADGPTRWKSIRRTLRAGQVLALRIDYYQGAGDRSLRLAWRTPTRLREEAERARQLDRRQATRLPAGCDWFDFWTGRRHAGDTTPVRDYALDEFPLFVRAGSILPMGPARQHTGDLAGAPIELRICPGADARFTLYDDDGSSYAYESGERATIALHWDDAAQVLHIGPRTGRYAGMPAQQVFDVSLWPPARPAAAPRRVTYQGRAQSIVLKRTR